MTAYLDSSIVLRYILSGEEAIRHAPEFPAVDSSKLLDIESRRVFFRCRLAGQLDDRGFIKAIERHEEFLDGIDCGAGSCPRYLPKPARDH
jgi:hypothetical protein